jgi:hypothetical protein
MPPSPNAHIVLNVRDRTGGEYNNAQFNANNQNIIQGQIHSVSVAEVNFPYDIPNVQQGYNVFILTSQFGVELDIVLSPGFYTGAELVVLINNLIVAAGAAQAPPILAVNLPTVAYNAVDNLFRFDAPTSNVPNFVWYISSPVTLPFNGIGAVGPGRVGKDILSILGYDTSQDGDNFVDSDPVQQNLTFPAASSAPLTFTQYVDICSPQMCKFQYFRDGSTTNLARRADVICRLYISNNVSIIESEGQRPFVISRQFFNERVMRWTADNSVGTIDIQLYDDCGEPLTTTWQPRPYQITFNAYELDK